MTHSADEQVTRVSMLSNINLGVMTVDEVAEVADVVEVLAVDCTDAMAGGDLLKLELEL